MGDVSLPTLKRLFANSRNECSFEGCDAKLVTDDGVVVGRICHIKGSKPGAPRYDGNQSEEERHAYDNLLLLCGPHHDVIDKDKSRRWTVESLLAMKSTHETRGPSEPDDERVCKQLIQNETIYEEGIRIGSIRAQTVQMAQGDIHNYPPTHSAAPTPRGREADRATLAKIIELLGANTLTFLRTHDFYGSFFGEDLHHVRTLWHEYDGPEHEFLNKTLEQERLNLRQAIDDLLSLISRLTFPLAGNPKSYRVQRSEDFLPAREWSPEERAKRRLAFEEGIAKSGPLLNEAANALVAAYEKIVRVARSELEH